MAGDKARDAAIRAASGPPPMHPARLRQILLLMGWGQRTLAEHLGVNPTGVRRWATGEGEPPHMKPAVAQWLETLAAELEADARMPGWHTRQAQAVREALKRHPLPLGWSTVPPPARRVG